MNVTVNNEQREVREGQTVRQLIEELGLAGKAVAVELNCEVIPRKVHDTTVLKPGDAVELVTLVGGG